ncbi:MAG: ABC transporter ATP-binding protein [Candidatus Bathyarchaeia archaeon]
MPSLQLVNVTKKFGKITAINNFSLDIKDKEYICVLGPTGSGKTTLLKLIAGIIKPDKGEIYIDGKLVNDVPPQERNTAYVPQQYALFPHLNVIENTAFGPVAKWLNKDEAYKISRQMLEMTRLAWRADSYPNELSGGMQQRLALARGLASGANLLLLDEPLGALDARIRVELRYKLRDLIRDKGLTAIHVTHDQEEAMAVANRMVVLRNGQIQQEGAPFTVYEKPNSIFVAHFVGGANFLEGFITEIDQHGSWLQLRNGFIVRIKETHYSLGERVVLMIREEMVKIIKKERRKEEINLFSGTVEAVSFLGNFIIYRILLDNGDVVQSKVPVKLNREMFSSGTKVYVRLESEYIKTYPYPSVGLYQELEVM